MTRRISVAAGMFLMVGLPPTVAGTEAPERVAVGQEAPEIALPDLGDETHTLSALRGEKNAVLVFFRGGW